MLKNSFWVKKLGFILISLSFFLIFFLFLSVFFSPSKIFSPPKISLLKIEKEKIPSVLEAKKRFTKSGPLVAFKKRKEVLKPFSSQKIIFYTNLERQKRNIPSLSQNQTLNLVAEKRIKDMVDFNYFAHESPSGNDAKTLAEKLGYSYLLIGENLAFGYFKDEKDIVEAWMKSKGHRENILNESYKEIGVAVKIVTLQKRKGYLAVQIFATPSSVCPLPDQNLLGKIKEMEKEKEEMEKRLLTKKEEIEKIEKEIEKIYEEATQILNEGDLLIKKGNELVKKGNEIYTQTGDEKEAERYWQEGEKLQEEGKEMIKKALSFNEVLREKSSKLEEKIKAYNQLVEDYNSFIKDLKRMIEDYNFEVKKYNQCLQSL